MTTQVSSASPLDIPVMQRDAVLEELSDKVRHGEGARTERHDQKWRKLAVA